MKFIDKPLQNLDAYSLEQLKSSVPEAMSAYAALKARVDNRDVIVSDLDFIIKEPTGELNYVGLKSAMERLEDGAADYMPAAYKVGVKAELIRHLREISEELNGNMDIVRTPPIVDFKVLEDMLRREFEDDEDFENAYEALKKILGSTESLAQSTYLPSADFRPFPNYRKLGIDRDAGIASEEELAMFSGQTKPDGSPVTAEDFFSVPGLFANNDLIEDRSMRIPALELGRLGVMLALRAKSSDLDHGFKAEDCFFRIVSPKIGVDKSIKLSHKLNGIVSEPYTALLARAIFPVMENGKQVEVVDKVRRQLLQDLSITPLLESYSCGTCGELIVTDVSMMDGKLVALKVDLGKRKEVGSMREHYAVTIRTPNSAVAGGFVYTDLHVLISENGQMSVNPTKLDLPNGSVVLAKMEPIPMLSSGGITPRYCGFHGLQGWKDENGCQVVANVTNIKGILNCALTSSGAIKDARLILSADNTV